MSTATAPDILTEARRLFDAGLELLPNHPTAKYPKGYDDWQKGGFDWPELARHLKDGGALGNLQGTPDALEGVDLDTKHWLGDPAELRTAYEQMVEDHAPGLLARLLIVATPTDGRHYRYRCPGAIERNQKLAERPPTPEELAANPKAKAITLIETRGIGGQFMIPPSPGYRLLQGDLAAIPEITPEERAILLACARAFTQVAARTVSGTPRKGDGRPGDHYNQNGGVDEALELLEGDGWTIVGSRGATTYLRRPGKTRGVSATYGHIAPGVFYCFTSNGSPFDPNTSYLPFAVRSLLVHGGDYGAAAKEIAERYGMPYYPEGEPKDDRGVLCCPKHGRMLVPSKHAGWIYCQAKAGEGYCSYSARVPGYTPPSPAEAAPQTGEAPGPTAALARALEAAGYHATLNTETDEITVNGELLSDVTRALLRGAVRDRRLGSVNILDDALTLQAHQNRVAPIRDGLGALEWDGQPHIARLAACLQTGAGEVITYPPGEHRRAAEVFLLRWLLGAVGRAFDGEQNAMLVLDGPQGIGKSSLVSWLGGALPGVYCEESISPQDKDCLFRLTRTLVWEAPELDAVTRRHDAAALKHFLTRSTVTARRAYGRHDITKPVLTSFIGTVNTNGNGFLPDPTGNRRYMVLTLTGIDHAYSQQLTSAQVWAEAVARYRTGERGRLTAEEAAYRDRVNAEQHQTTGLMDDWLAMYFEVTGDADDLLTSGEIAAHLASKSISLGGNDRASAMAIADALTRAGVGRAERRAALAHYGDFRRAWRGVAIRQDEPTSPANQPRTNLSGKVASPRHNAGYRLSEPTDPTYRKEIENTGYGASDHLPGGGAGAAPSQGLRNVAGQVGSQEASKASEGSDPTIFEDGSGSDRDGSDRAEDGSHRLPDGYTAREDKYTGRWWVTNGRGWGEYAPSAEDAATKAWAHAEVLEAA